MGGFGGLVYLVLSSAQQKKGHTTHESIVICVSYGFKVSPWSFLTDPKV